MELLAHVPGDLIYIIEGLVLFSVATEFLPALKRALPEWMSRSRKPALVPDVIAASVTDIPVDENGKQAVEQAPPTDKTTMRSGQEE
jgi:simple sugar transport system permease protein